jgi:hypothetical protein
MISALDSDSVTATESTTYTAKSPAKRSKYRPRLHPAELSSKISKFFSPTLFPRTPNREPCPPSLAYSRLPPPCAELDPAPTRRIRRFRKWRDAVPELRLVLLDPRRRGRYDWLIRPNARAERHRSPDQVSDICPASIRRLAKGSQEESISARS